MLKANLSISAQITWPCKKKNENISQVLNCVEIIVIINFRNSSKKKLIIWFLEKWLINIWQKKCKNSHFLKPRETPPVPSRKSPKFNMRPTSICVSQRAISFLVWTVSLKWKVAFFFCKASLSIDHPLKKNIKNLSTSKTNQCQKI